VEETLKMTRGSRYRVPLRRRREKKTDYKARKGFVVSGRPRLVARCSLKNTIAQIVVAKPVGDVVLASAHSRELIKTYGWKAATGNLPAAYLTGLLCGLKAKKNGVSEAILDLGLVSPTKSSKVFTTMAGVVDAGITIPHDEEKIIKERSRGDHIVEYAESLGTPEEYAPIFSTLIAQKLSPTEMGEHFNKVKADIFAAFGITWKPEPLPAKKPAAKKPEPKPTKAEAKKPETKPEARPEATKPAAKTETKEPVAEPKPTETKVSKAEPKPAEAKKEEPPKSPPKSKKPAAKAATKKTEKPEKTAKAKAKPNAEKEPAAKKEIKETSKKSSKPTKSKSKTAKTGGKKE
jgi:large subunit ribosomal protein L18